MNLSPNARWVAVIFLLPIPVTLFKSFEKRRLLDRQDDINTIRALPWRDFELLLGEVYRRQGYTVFENPGAGPDGGIDLVVKKDKNLYLVQCKQWKTRKVGVKIVREMFGLMHDRKTAGVIIVTSGMFTQEAKTFAAGKSIDLVEGQQLVVMVRTVQENLKLQPIQEQHKETLCPKCGSKMVVREAKRGKHAGTKFLGCSSFPKCRYVQPYRF